MTKTRVEMKRGRFLALEISGAQTTFLLSPPLSSTLSGLSIVSRRLYQHMTNMPLSGSTKQWGESGCLGRDLRKANTHF